MNRNNKSRVYVASALLIALLFSVLHIASSNSSNEARIKSAVLGAVDTLEGRATNFRFRLRGEHQASNRVVIVAIDQKSAQKFGLWPWPREVLAKALTNLVDAKAAAIGLDMTFADETSREAVLADVLHRLEQVPSELSPQVASLQTELRESLNHSPDAALEAALRHGKDVIVQGVIPFANADAKDFSAEELKRFNTDVEGSLIRSVPGKSPGSTFELHAETALLWNMHSVQTPLPRFVRTGAALGHFGVDPDADGTIRRSAALAFLSGPDGA